MTKANRQPVVKPSVEAIPSAKLNTKGAIHLFNPVYGWYYFVLVIVATVLLSFGSYVLYCIIEQQLNVWSLLQAKLSEMSLALSEQASEVKRLLSLLSEYEAKRLSSESTVANTLEGQSKSGALLSEVKSLFAYALFVAEQVWSTLGLLLVTCVTGLFSWVDWSCTIIKDLLTRIYSDPRGLLFNLLLFGCLSATLGLVALSCLVGSFIMRYLVPSESGLPKHLWSCGFFLLGMLNPTTWIPSWGTSVVPNPQPEASSSAVDLAQLSDKLDASTVLLEDRLQAVETSVNAARLNLPEEIRHLGEQGQGSLNQAVEILQIKQELGHLAVIRELAQNTVLTSEVLQRAADLHAQAQFIEQKQASSLSEVSRVTSSLPDKLSLLELKLDDLTREALVLKSLSLDSSATVELTSRAVRHLLKGKGSLAVSSSVKRPEALVLEGPSSLSEEELSYEEALSETPQGISSSSDKRIFIPSALEKSSSQGALSRSTSASTNTSLDVEASELAELDAFDWAAEELSSRATVSSRAAEAEVALGSQMLRNKAPMIIDGSDLFSIKGETLDEAWDSCTQNPIFVNWRESVSRSYENPLFSVVKESGSSSSGGPSCSGLQYNQEAAAEAASSASQLANAAKSYAMSNLSIATQKSVGLRTRLDLLGQQPSAPQLSALSQAPLASPLDSTEALIIVTPAMLKAARRGPLTWPRMYGFAASGALQETANAVNVGLCNTGASASAHPVPVLALQDATASASANPVPVSSEEGATALASTNPVPVSAGQDATASAFANPVPVPSGQATTTFSVITAQLSQLTSEDIAQLMEILLQLL